MNTERLKNPWFWVGILGVVLTAMGVRAESLTSWEIVIEDFFELIKNPYMLGSVVMSLMGIFTGYSKEEVFEDIEDAKEEFENVE